MIHGSLESGIGGFELAADAMGWENAFHCENNPFCQRILNYYWPQSKSYADIFEFDGTPWRGKIGVLTAGFPCQPFSHAGSRQGTKDDRFLWPENIRVIKEIMPEWVVLENVTGLFTILQPESVSEVESKEIQLFCEDENYQVNSTIERIQRRIIGVIIEEIQSAGYSLPQYPDGTPILLCIPAVAKGAVHRRDRIWIVAHRNGNGFRNINGYAKDTGSAKENQGEGLQRERFRGKPGGTNTDASDTQQQGLERCPGSGEQSGDFQSERCIGDAADHKSERLERSIITAGQGEKSDEQFITGYDRKCDATNAGGQGLEKSKRGRAYKQGTGPSQPNAEFIKTEESWIEAATRLCRVDDEFSRRLDTTAISRPKWRIESLKAYGNTIYWLIAYEIFQSIQSQYEK